MTFIKNAGKCPLNLELASSHLLTLKDHMKKLFRKGMNMLPLHGNF
jgi:hypothetical protein